MVPKASARNIPAIIFLISCCFLMIFPSAAQEYPEDFRFKGYYKVTFSGPVFAKVGVDFSQSGSDYAATADIASAGLLKLFTKHSSHNTVKAQGGKVAYVTDYTTKKKKRHVDITYGNGKFISENLVPPESATKRQPVSLELKNGSYDPLSALIMARSKLRNALASGSQEFSLNIYDGRRLTGVDFKIIGKKNIKLYGVKRPVIEVAAKRKLVAGFSKDELADFDENEAPLIFYFSNDATLFLIRLEHAISMGVITADLMKQCNEQESCLLGNKQ